MTVEASAMRKLMGRVVPLLAVGAVFQAFSQLNVAFAGLEMTRDLGLSATEFGFGSGIFFLSYLILGVPANLLLLRFGARRWIALAMVTWGLLCAALALTQDATSFYALRFLLGAAEAGFIPGILYMSGAWFPDRYRARVLSLLLVCNPIAAMLGGPISGLLLQLDGAWRLAGWQWVFVVEGLPASLLGLWVWRALPDAPHAAAWLDPDERAWLADTLAAERVGADGAKGFSAAAFVDRRVIALSLVFLGVSSLPFGLIFFLPKIIEAFGATPLAASMLSALPFATGAVLMLLWSRSSDRTGERLYHALAGLAVAIAGSALYLLSPTPVIGLVGLCLTFGGTFSFLPIFWAMPSRLLTGTVAATGIAIINGMGGVAGLVAPTVMGALADQTGSYRAGLACVLAAACAAGLLLLIYGRRRGLQVPVPAAEPVAA